MKMNKLTAIAITLLILLTLLMTAGAETDGIKKALARFLWDFQLGRHG